MENTEGHAIADQQKALPPTFFRQDEKNAFQFQAKDRFKYRYELVRRIAKLLNTPATRKLVTSKQLGQLEMAKPFEALDFRERHILLHEFYLASDERPAITTSKYLHERLGDYSVPFPSDMRFDLRASPNAIAEEVVAWWEEQRRRAGLDAVKQLGPKGFSSRNRAQNYQPPNWEQLRWLDNPKGFKLKSRGHASIRRRRMRPEALKYLPVVLAALERIERDRHELGEEVEPHDALHGAAQAMVACFLGNGSEVAAMTLPFEPYYSSDNESCRMDFYSKICDLSRVKACSKKKDLANARKHAARGIMFHMAREAADGRRKPEECWAEATLEDWFMDNFWEPPEDLRWSDLDPNTYAEGVGASARLVSLIYPLPENSADGIAAEAYALYLKACEWIVELFKDKRVWQAVEALARELIRSRHLENADILRLIDGGDHTLAYLEQLAASQEWQDRIGLPPLPQPTAKELRENEEAQAKQNAEFQKQCADPKWQEETRLHVVTSFAANEVMLWFLRCDVGPAPMPPPMKWHLGFSQHIGERWRNGGEYPEAANFRGEATSLNDKDSTVVRRQQAARGIMKVMAPHAAWARHLGNEAWASYLFKALRRCPPNCFEGVDWWEDLNPADWDYEGVPASVWLAGRTFPNCKLSASLHSTKAGCFYLEVCGWLSEFFADERVWKAVQTLAAKLQKRGGLKPGDIPKILDGKDRTNAYLDDLASSTKWLQRIGAADTTLIDYVGIMRR